MQVVLALVPLPSNFKYSLLKHSDITLALLTTASNQEIIFGNLDITIYMKPKMP